MTQTNYYYEDSIVMINDSTDVSASGEAIITLPTTAQQGTDFENFSLTVKNADTSYTLAISIQVSNTVDVSSTDADWVSLTDDYGASSFTVAASGTFAAHLTGKYRWWRVYATASSASFGANGNFRAVLSR